MAHYAVHFDPAPGYARRYRELVSQDGLDTDGEVPSVRYVDTANGAVVIIPPYIPNLPKSAEGIFRDILARHEETRLESFASASLRLSCSVHELLALIVETCAGPSPRARNRVAAAAVLMDSRYAENLTLPLIAAAANYTPNYLSGEFARAYGLTPMEYLRERRLRRAKELLRTSSLSIKEIACLVGIGDQYYFSKVFSARNGLSPSKYRQLSNPDGRQETSHATLNAADAVINAACSPGD
jgi:AraC-like DNA-binding protein